jgi:DNA-binding NarL/FixJ family response regulator
MARLWLGDFDGAIGLADAARTMAPNDPITTSLALSVVALARTMRGDLHGGLDLIDDAVRLADHSRGRQGHRCPVRLYQGIILLLLDQLAEARAALEAGRRGGEELGQRWPLPSYQFHLALVRFLEGDWDDAITDIEAGLDLADEVGERYGVVLAHSVTALIALHRDDLRAAAEADAACESEIATTGSRLAPEQTLARALLLEANGEVSEARARFAEFWYPCVGAGLAVQCAVLAPELVRLCLADGDARQAREVAEVMVDLSVRTDVAWISGAAARCRGLVEGDPDVLEQAADTCRHSPRPLDRAIAAEQAGVALAQVGRRDDAVRLLVEADATYETLRATRDVTRTEALLRDLGVRRGRRGPRKRPQLGWDSLTPTEVRVASLVAEGLSNRAIGDRLFISHRTVQTHVAHLFIKLGVSSRTKLGAEVTRRRADAAG